MPIQQMKIQSDLVTQFTPSATIILDFTQTLQVKCIASDMDEVVESALAPTIEVSDDCLGKHRIFSALNLQHEKKRGILALERTIEITIEFATKNRLLKALKDMNILEMETPNFDGVFFTQFYLVGWDTVELRGDTCSFDVELNRGELKYGNHTIPSVYTSVY